MKHVIEARIKHRLVGLAVIILIGSIVMPAIMKKSTPFIDEKIQASNKSKSNLVLSQDNALFKQVGMGRVKMELPTSHATKEAIIVVKKELPIPVIDVLPSIKIADFTPIEPLPLKKDMRVANATMKSKKLLTTSKKLSTKSIKETYLLQLGTFTQQSNAVLLVKTLRKKGYKATYSKTHNKKGIIFKVFIGNANYKKNAIILQQQLVSTLQMKGLIVPTTRVS